MMPQVWSGRIDLASEAGRSWHSAMKRKRDCDGQVMTLGRILAVDFGRQVMSVLSRGKDQENKR